jgi:HAE1 family hydrophobic/amphiphilic exporter-1/multidrug efflux pump
MAERKLSPKEAAIESMREVTGAIVAIELVLISVFVPVAFLGGLAGRLYQQFAVTVATAVSISGVLALTLTPAMCALLLKPQHAESRIFRPFNRGFAWVTDTYVRGVRLGIARWVVGLILFAAVLAIDVILFRTVPSGFVPSEDQGYLIGGVILPDGATLQRTDREGKELQGLIGSHPALSHMFYVSGFDLIGGGSKTNAATIFLPLKPWKERTTSAEDFAKFVMGKGASVTGAIVLAFNPPPIRGLGTAGGFEAWLQDRADADPRLLAVQLARFTDALRKRTELTGINSFFRPTVPQLFVDVDREKATSLGVPINTIFDALQSTMGPLYVNDFNRSGRTFRVQIQADAGYRDQPEDINQFYVKNNDGTMVPLSSVVATKNIAGPEFTNRFNLFRAAQVTGVPAPGYSSGQATDALQEVAKQTLPREMGYDWADMSYQEVKAAGAGATELLL